MFASIKKISSTVALTLSLFTVGAFAETPRDSELVIGTIGNNINKKTKNYAPIAAYLQKNLSGVGITSVRTHVVPSSEEMANELRDGNVDIYLDSPLVAAKVAKLSGSSPVLRHWKKGVADYYSVILVPTDSEMTKIEDLNGKRIAFQERDSTSGFMLPADMILSKGLTMDEKSRPQNPYKNDRVNYYFSGSDRHTITWLAKGWVEAAGTDYKAFQKLDKARPGQYKILAKSVTVPRHVVVQSAQTDTKLGKAVADVLMNMDKDPEGKEILKGLKKTKKFDHFPDGVEATFKPIYAIVDRLEQHDLF